MPHRNLHLFLPTMYSHWRGLFQSHTGGLEQHVELRKCRKSVRFESDQHNRRILSDQINEPNKDHKFLSHLSAFNNWPTEEEYPTNIELPYPRDIVKHLDSFVVGQDFAKRALAVGLYQHYKRLENNSEFLLGKRNRMRLRTQGADNRVIFNQINDENSMFLDKSNIVLLGPSGSGKTFLTQKLAEILRVPFAMCDCTSLTQAGYVGEDVESVIQKLLENSDGIVGTAQRGIVFLDEFDKIYTSLDSIHTSGNRDVNGKGVQQALLKLIEGTNVVVKSPVHSNSKIEVNTTDILFIASGAFSNLEKIIARRVDERTIGFGSQFVNLAEDIFDKDEIVASNRKNSLLKMVEASDLIQFGFVPELVGRFPVLVPFHSFDHEALLRVMKEPKNNIIQQAQRLFKIDGIQLKFTQGALNEIAKQAIQKKTGARALRSIIEKVLLAPKFECLGGPVTTVIITAGVVRGEAQYFTNYRSNESLDISLY